VSKTSILGQVVKVMSGKESHVVNGLKKKNKKQKKLNNGTIIKMSKK
jgi:hypothetical protein